MANLLRWLVGWMPSRRPCSSGREVDDAGDSIGMEAAFAPTQPAMLKEPPKPGALDTDWAIRRLNSRSVQ